MYMYMYVPVYVYVYMYLYSSEHSGCIVSHCSHCLEEITPGCQGRREECGSLAGITEHTAVSGDTASQSPGRPSGVELLA